MKQTLKYIYGIIFESLKFAESKHSIILTLASAVLAFSTTFLGQNIIVNLLGIASIVFALIAILYSFFALMVKRVKIKNFKNKKNDDLLSYKNIIRFDEFSYIEQIKKDYAFTNLYKPDKMDYDLARQIITNSKLTYIKFMYFNFALIFLFSSILCLIGIVLIRGQVW